MYHQIHYQTIISEKHKLTFVFVCRYETSVAFGRPPPPPKKTKQNNKTKNKNKNKKTKNALTGKLYIGAATDSY